MPQLPRFYAPPAAWRTTDGLVELDSGETHHCVDVIRVAPGDRVSVFDGCGNEAVAVLSSRDRKHASLAIESCASAAPRRSRIALAVAIPKGRNIEWIIEKAVELGVADIFPLLTARTVVKIPPHQRAARAEKWRRTAIEACKQCGQNWLPNVAEPAPWGEFCPSLAPGDFDLALIGSLEPDTRPMRSRVDQFRVSHGRAPRSACLIIGPEGDLTQGEYADARARGWQPVTFGELVLRVETAALYAMSVLRHELDAAEE
jgi:16S rRNA (uracil1498-N3)-methyltransferase